LDVLFTFYSKHSKDLSFDTLPFSMKYPVDYFFPKDAGNNCNQQNQQTQKEIHN
jgi:hypothetical protein